jgi:hypothetical protein
MFYSIFFSENDGRFDGSLRDEGPNEFSRCHDFQHDDTRHKGLNRDTQHKDSQNNVVLSVAFLLLWPNLLC